MASSPTPPASQLRTIAPEHAISFLQALREVDTEVTIKYAEIAHQRRIPPNTVYKQLNKWKKLYNLKIALTAAGYVGSDDGPVAGSAAAGPAAVGGAAEGGRSPIKPSGVFKSPGKKARAGKGTNLKREARAGNADDADTIMEVKREADGYDNNVFHAIAASTPGSEMDVSIGDDGKEKNVA